MHHLNTNLSCSVRMPIIPPSPARQADGVFRPNLISNVPLIPAPAYRANFSLTAPDRQPGFAIHSERNFACAELLTHIPSSSMTPRPPLFRPDKNNVEGRTFTHLPLVKSGLLPAWTPPKGGDFFTSYPLKIQQLAPVIKKENTAVRVFQSNYCVVPRDRTIATYDMSWCSTVVILHGDEKTLMHIYGSRLSACLLPQSDIRNDADPRGGDIILSYCKTLAAEPEVLKNSRMIVMFGPDVYKNLDNNEPRMFNPLTMFSQRYKTLDGKLHQPLLTLLSLFNQNNTEICHGEQIYISERDELMCDSVSAEPVKYITAAEREAIFSLLPGE